MIENQELWVSASGDHAQFGGARMSKGRRILLGIVCNAVYFVKKDVATIARVYQGISRARISGDHDHAIGGLDAVPVPWPRSLVDHAKRSNDDPRVLVDLTAITRDNMGLNFGLCT